MAAGLLTLEEAKGEEGVDWIDFLDQKKRENDYAEELGLPLPHVEAVAASGAGAGAGTAGDNAGDDAGELAGD
jgi:capsid protein